MKSLRHCSNAALQTRCTWAIRLALLFLVVMTIGYGLAFAQSFGLSSSDYVALWKPFLGFGCLGFPFLGYYALAAKERGRRRFVKGLVEVLDEIDPEPDTP